MLKLHHLRDFTAIADARSVRGAARALGLAQPALTRSLRELEQHLGVTLLERHSRGVSLTADGERLLVRARVVMQELRRAEEDAAPAGGALRGTVLAGLSGAATLALLAPAYQAFRRDCPQVQLRLMEGLFPLLEARLADGTMDFFVGPLPPRLNRRSYHCELLFHNQRMVMARPGHPLAGARSLAELQQADWIITGLTERPEEEFDEQFRAHGLEPPQARTRCDSVMGILTLMQAGAIALLPQQFAQSPLYAGKLVALPLQQALQAPDIVLIRRAALPLTAAAERLAVALQRAAGTPLPPLGR